MSGKSALGEDYRLTDLRFPYRTNGRKWRTKLVVRIAGMLWGADIRMSFVFRLVPGQERNVCFIPVLGKSGHRPHHSVPLTSTPKRRIYRAATSKYQPCQRIDFSFDRHHAFDLPVHRLLASRFACGFGYGVEPFSDLLIALWTAQYHCKPQGTFQRPQRPAIPTVMLLADRHKWSTRLQYFGG